MKIEEFEVEIIKAKPGEIVAIKFPIEKYDVDFIWRAYQNLKEIMPEGVELMMIPCDWSIEVQNDNLH